MIKPVSISVLMSAYNAERYIAEAIRSVLDQTFTDFEFIIIDDGSTDNTWAIIQSFTDARIKASQQANLGLSAALNNGLKQAKGKYIARFDADDTCYPQRLAVQYAFMEEHPGYIVTGSAGDYADEEGTFIFKYTPPGSTNEEIQQVKETICPFIHSSVLFRWEVIVRTGGYDEHAHSFEDHLLWLIVLQTGKGYNMADSLIRVRLNPASVTINADRRPKEFHRIKKNALRQRSITAADGERLLAIIRQQDIKKIKQEAYYSLLAKKFLWNNPDPRQARKYLAKAIGGDPFMFKNYGYYLLSFLPAGTLQKSYRSFKSIPHQREKIRLLVDAHSFDNEYQGSRSFIKGIYTELADRYGIQLFIAAYDIENLRHNFPAANNIHFLQLRSRKSYWRLAVDIPWLIRKYKIDYAHFQYILPLFRNCTQVVTIHDVLFREDPHSFSPMYRALKTFLYKRSARLADLVTTVSLYSKNSIIEHLETGAAKIDLIPNGVAPHFFEPYDKKAAKAFIQQAYGFDRFLLCVSRFEPRKNQLLLVKEYLRLALQEKGYRLVLLGHETMATPGLHALLNSLDTSVRSFIFISATIGNDELLQFYRAADLFIYPSQSEGFGIPPLEAGAVGIPVICSNRSAMRDFSFFGRGHIDPLLPDVLYNTIAAMLGEPPDKNALRSIADEICKKYSWETAAGEFYQLILKHSTKIHDQFSTTGNEERRMEAQLSAGKTFSLSRDR